MKPELNKKIINENPEKEYNKASFQIKEINAIEDDPLYCGSATIMWATYNTVNLRPDRMVSGCFDEEMSRWVNEKYPRFVKDHNQGVIIGKVENAYNMEEGPIVEIKFINTSAGRDAYIELKTSAKDEFSYAWYPIEYQYVEENGVVIREVYKAKWIEEISHVTYGVDPNTKPLEVNSKDLTIRHAETALKNAGFSNKDSKTILSNGFKALNRDDSEQRDAELDNTLKEGFENLLNSLKGNNHGTE